MKGYRRRLSLSDRRPEPPVIEALDQRAMLDTVPFPALTDLRNANDTVVRVVTNLGTFDLDLFDAGTNAAPITVTNFLGYVRRGSYDEGFFHRFAHLTGGTPFVLQGGGFRFIDGTGVSTTATLPAVQNEFSPQRSNVLRTIAMAKLGNDPNSATDQWFINLQDNSSNLDNQNGGFTVFGRIANDASWNVVQTITALTTRNFNSQLQSTAFDEVPVVNGTPQNPATVTESMLVTTLDVEIIKEKNVQEYYSESAYYPEGFAGSHINEFLPIENTTDVAVFYQVIARSEVPQGTAANGFTWFRDKVISTGSINGNARGGITVSHFGANGAPSTDDLVPQGVPYGLEIRSTRALSANISHYDFGTSTGEAFTRATSTTWGIADGFKLAGSNGVSDFLVWSNPNLALATVTITFFFQNQDPVTLTATTDMMRRGGLNLNQIGSIPNNTAFSISLQSDQPIVAALTHFDSRNASDPRGSAELGISGSGSRFGVVPFGNVGPGGQAGANTESIAVLNTGTASVVVNFTLSFSTPGLQPLFIPAGLIVPSQRRGVFDLSTLAQLADGRRYSIQFEALPTGSSAVFAGWQHRQSFTGINNADDIANAVGVVAATNWQFAEGFMDPARAGHDIFETVSIYNPNFRAGFGGADAVANVTVRLRYGDSHILTLPAVQVAAGGRLDLDLHTIQAVLNEGTQNHRFFYSIEVASDVVVVAQMRHFDLTLGGAQPSGGFATLGAPFGTITRLDALGGG